jgi:hypothetical protein
MGRHWGKVWGDDYPHRDMTEAITIGWKHWARMLQVFWATYTSTEFYIYL